MLLVLHVLGARIFAGVRVGGAGVEIRSEGNREAQVFFWNYRTLEGHVEAGQRDFEVWKWHDSGEVEFRTHATSRPADSHPLVLLGFRLLGRHKQVEFGRRACNRMALLTEARTRKLDATDPVETPDSRLVAVYARDHHALLVALRELARRMATDARPPDEHRFAADVARAATSDLDSVETLLNRLDSTPSRTRLAVAWGAEKAGRMKLNGRILRRSPLAAVTELEGCRLLLESSRALWTGLDQLGIGPPDAAERARASERLLGDAERLRLVAVHRSMHQTAESVGVVARARP